MQGWERCCRVISESACYDMQDTGKWCCDADQYNLSGSVKNRLESGQGLSLAEFCYPLMQAWDYWVLFQKGVQIQVGGSDQEGNILFGVQMIKDLLKNDPQNEFAPQRDEDPHLKLPVGVTTPLITTSTGEKLGKSDGNAIWLDGDMTPPFDFYQV